MPSACTSSTSSAVKLKMEIVPPIMAYNINRKTTRSSKTLSFAETTGNHNNFFFHSSKNKCLAHPQRPLDPLGFSPQLCAVYTGKLIPKKLCRNSLPSTYLKFRSFTKFSTRKDETLHKENPSLFIKSLSRFFIVNFESSQELSKIFNMKYILH